MSHSLPRFAVIVSLGFTLSTAAVAQQSLGEAARELRKNKPPEPTTKVITNDDLGPSVPLTPTKDSDKADSAKKSDSGNSDKKKEASSADDQAKLDKEWEDKIAAQKDQIALLERELDVLQRETKLRASNYYADAGTRLRNEQKYVEQDRKSRDEIAAKQKAIEDAKSKLEQLREEARKAGASPGAIS